VTADILLVNNYQLTNTSAYESEFQMQGTLGFGRPQNTTNCTYCSSSFLAKAYKAGLINQTIWAYAPDPLNYENPGSILIGGWEQDAVVGAQPGIMYVNTPVQSDAPDSW